MSPDQATADRPAYRAQGGYSGSVLTLSLTKRYPRHWLGLFVRANLLQGAAFEGSPLLEERTGRAWDRAALTAEVVGLKAEIERFREQVQNVE